MKSAARRGAASGAIIGMVVALLLGLIVIGTDEIPQFADQEDLAPLYVLAAVIGAIVGSVTGLIGLVLAANVASSSSATPVRRRVYGTLIAAGVSAVAGLVTVAPIFFGFDPVAVITVAVLGGGTAWFLLPGTVDLGTPPTPTELPPFGTPSRTAARPRSRAARWWWTVGTALVAFYVGAGIAGNAATDLGASHRAAGVIAFVAAVGVGAVAATSTWFLMARRR